MRLAKHRGMSMLDRSTTHFSSATQRQDDTPLVSIIIPCYVSTRKHLELLMETLETIASQTVQNYEIIIVDDGSSMDVGARTAGRLRTITLRQANAGSAMARNKGIEASSGDYLVFLDADDYLLPNAL